MKRAALLGLLLISCAHGSTPSATSTSPVAARPEPALRGRLLSASGAPLPLAHLAIHAADGKPGEALEVERDGTFRVPLSALTGGLGRITLSGADHHSVTLLLAREDGAFDVTVKLGSRGPHGVGPSLIVDRSTAKRMTAQPDGTFVAEVEVPDGRHSYTIGGVSDLGLSGEPVNGWARNEEGMYEPQIDVSGGKARVTFDPRKHVETASSAVFSSSGSASEELTDIAFRVTRSDQKVQGILGDLLHGEGGAPRDVGAKLAAARRGEETMLRQYLAQRARSAARPLVKHAAQLAYFTGTSIKSPSKEEESMANTVLAEVVPEDPLWGSFDAIVGVLRVVGPTPAAADYARTFVERQPSSAAVGKVLLRELENATDDAARRALVSQLDGPRFANTREQQRAADLDPDRTLAPGKELAFDVAAITGKPGSKLTPKQLTGKVFLVDIWGTWCAPCVAEMPDLHEVYAKYGGAPRDGRTKRFEIVSIALEPDAERVAKFRAQKEHPMPWVHGLADPETFLDAFVPRGRKGVPLHVLVDEKGKVLASSPRLGVEELPELLDRALR